MKVRRFVLQKVLHTDDSPHTVALGTAIAVFIALLPLVGIQTVLAIAIAALFRANKAVCIPIVWITNPFTIVPVYGSCWALGRRVLSSPSPGEHEAMLSQLAHLTREASVFGLDFWKDLAGILEQFGAELWLGCALVGFVLGVASYFLTRAAVSGYRERRRQRVLRRQLFRAKLGESRLSRDRESA